MKLFQTLDQELDRVPAGVKAGYYYVALGYRKDPAAPPPALRANGIYSLFTEAPAHILPSELIAGNTFSLYTDADETFLKFMKGVYDRYGHRNFFRNSDHFAPEYPLILRGGVKGMLADIDASRSVHAAEPEKLATLDAMEKTLRGFLRMIGNYADRAGELKGDPAYSPERLAFIESNCRALLDGAPETFAQALQLVWLCHNAFVMEGRYAMALGRIDQYLYPFYQKDVSEGIIDDAGVVELLENVFIRLKPDIVNICIGGTNPDGSCAVNPLSECVLQAVKNCQIPGPNLSCRVTANTPDEFLDHCLQSIGTGLGYPALMNDAVNLAALSRFGYKKEDVYNYCMVGCIENFITGRQPPWSDGRFDTPRLFAYVLNRGEDKFDGTFGIDTGDPDGFSTMKDFMSALERQFDYYVEDYYAHFTPVNEGINQAYYPNPFLSCFCVDCIGRALDINCGGAVYPSVHGVGIMGVATVADSLAAIEKVVFVDHEATLGELRDALNRNFEGCEALREKLLAAPKYGNNDDFVDKYAVWLTGFAYRSFRRLKTRDGGYYYSAMASNTANIDAGRVIGATPDGRRAGEPLSDAASPTYGKDVRGTTATILSISKPDYTYGGTGGSVVNQKYSPAMFGDEKRKKLLALIRTYFARGGQEIQINSTSPEILRDAMDHPEKYPNLVVRVSGYSAFYVTLDRAIQTDILSRTQKDE